MPYAIREEVITSIIKGSRKRCMLRNQLYQKVYVVFSIHVGMISNIGLTLDMELIFYKSYVGYWEKF